MSRVKKVISGKIQNKLLVICGVVLLIVCIVSCTFFGEELKSFAENPALFREWLDRFGAFDELVFILLRAVQTMVKFIPAEPLEIGAGYAWGAVPGMIYCVIGNMIGTAGILAFTKKFGSRVREFFLPAENAESMGLLAVVQNSERIYVILFILYLIPGLPKDGFTYFVGLLPVKAVPFMIITGIARMPSVLTSTLCGANLARQQYWVSALIFAATIVMAVLGGMGYRAYTKRKSPKKGSI